jgi:conjugative relaxase-like TrwC/TraI family protein
VGSAVSGRYRRAQIEVAHRRAVASAVGRIERDGELVRRRGGGELRWENAKSLVAAEFVHTSSRLTRDQERDGVPDPQLHSYVVILTAQRQDGRFAAVDSRELFRSRRANGAWYRAELAHELRQLGHAVGDDRRRTADEEVSTGELAQTKLVHQTDIRLAPVCVAKTGGAVALVRLRTAGRIAAGGRGLPIPRLAR